MAELLNSRSASFYDSFTRKSGDPTVTHYCPGCGHGNVHKFIAEAADDFGIADRVIFVNPVGCSVFAYYYLDFGHVQAPHGRAPAVATAIKRARPDSIVIVYQGDGDLAAIGGNEMLHAANRGESLTVIFINNAIYGMTGGQMAPTTLIGQTTTTSPSGRKLTQEGFPMRVSELLGSLEAPAYIERCALGDAKHDMAARKAVRKAIRNQIDGKGYSLVEILSPCPTGWKLTPPDSGKFVLQTMTQTFPLKVVRDRSESPAEMTGARLDVPPEKIPEILGLEPAAGGGGLTAFGPGGAPASRGGGVEARHRNPRIKAAGFGGQGVLFLGTLIAEAGMLADLAVSWLPSYGPEMRGGTAHCHVILSEDGVDSPLVTRSTVLFAFNRPSLEKFAGEVVEGGLIVYDTSLIPDPPALPEGVETIPLPATRISDELGSTRAANIVALGAYISRTGVIPPESIEAALQMHHFKPAAIALNMKALKAGMEYERSRRSGS